MLEFKLELNVSTSFVIRLITSPTLTLSKYLSGRRLILPEMLFRILHASFCITVIITKPAAQEISPALTYIIRITIIDLIIPSISMPPTSPADIVLVKSAILSGAMSVSTVLPSDSTRDIIIGAYHGLRYISSDFIADFTFFGFSSCGGPPGLIGFIWQAPPPKAVTGQSVCKPRRCQEAHDEFPCRPVCPRQALLSCPHSLLCLFAEQQ